MVRRRQASKDWSSFTAVGQDSGQLFSPWREGFCYGEGLGLFHKLYASSSVSELEGLFISSLSSEETDAIHGDQTNKSVLPPTTTVPRKFSFLC